MYVIYKESRITKANNQKYYENIYFIVINKYVLYYLDNLKSNVQITLI